MKILFASAFVVTSIVIPAVSFADFPAKIVVPEIAVPGITVSPTPPGLQNKELPPGLQKKNKTPPGWSKGQKRGWGDKPHKMGGKGKNKRH